MILDLQQGIDKRGNKFGYVAGDGGGYFFTWHKTLSQTVASLEEDEVDGSGGLDEDDVAEFLRRSISSRFNKDLEAMVAELESTTGADMIIGNEDVADVAQCWIDAGFSRDNVSDWWDAGCFDASRAAILRDSRLTPEQVSQPAPESVLAGRSWGYAFCNNDCSIDDLVRHVR